MLAVHVFYHVTGVHALAHACCRLTRSFGNCRRSRRVVTEMLMRWSWLSVVLSS